MTINITSRIGQHQIPQRITQKQKKMTFLITWVHVWPIQIACLLGLQVSTTGSSCWPIWWWVYWYKAKCEMRDAAMQDRRRNERAKLWISREMETVATCSTTDRNGSYHRLVPSFFEEMTRCRRQKHCRRRPYNPNDPSKFRKYRVYLPLLRLFTSARSRLLLRG